MSLNQGEMNNYIVGSQLYQLDAKENESKYQVIVISRNEKVNVALKSTLQNFSLNGKSINVFFAGDIHEAQIIAKKIPDIVLVVIDDDIHVNGSYQLFEKYVRDQLGNKNCFITFKEDLIKTSAGSEITYSNDDPALDKFFYARERLIDITRMVMLTTDMESKINLPPLGNTNLKSDKGESESITKDKLYTVLAHDLKEPVSNIKVMLDFLTNEPDLLDKQTSKDLLSRVKESANNIHEMLQDFLFWSRMLNRDIFYNPTKLNIQQLINESIVLLRSTAEAKEICISSNFETESWVFADEYMMSTILRNLIYNAIKYTEEGGSILISANSSDRYLRVNVTDTGVGISAKNLKKLFHSDVYFTTSGTDKESGSGLGLVLCKDFVEKNGGEIFVESHESIGSTFSFTIPFAKTAAL